jgi:hypothetical protein
MVAIVVVSFAVFIVVSGDGRGSVSAEFVLSKFSVSATKF